MENNKENTELKMVAMAIVNNLYELAGLSIEHRQSLNDIADEMVMGHLIEVVETSQEQGREQIRELADSYTGIPDEEFEGKTEEEKYSLMLYNWGVFHVQSSTGTYTEYLPKLEYKSKK